MTNLKKFTDHFAYDESLNGMTTKHRFGHIVLVLSLSAVGCIDTLTLAEGELEKGGDSSIGGNTASSKHNTRPAPTAGTSAASGGSTYKSSATPTVDCGDGIVAGGEQCDDGNALDGDGCSASCNVETGFICKGDGEDPTPCLALCGDGIVRGGEQCDDGNAQSGDGCSPNCQLEQAVVCDGKSKPCPTSVCGNGVVEPGETCDLGVKNGGSGAGACATDCRSLGQCGDGIVQAPETCDDGNAVDGDGCNASCLVESGYTCSSDSTLCQSACGDGLLSPKEECDDGNPLSGDGCSAACTLEPGFYCQQVQGSATACLPACGDGIVAGAEECDNGASGSLDQYGGCTPSCTFGPHCGDGVVQADVEECDLGVQNGSGACSSSCRNLTP